MKTIYFAGGCFWGVQRYFSFAKGVVTTKVGYANGTIDNPKYEDLKAGLDDAAETVKVDYDENILSLEKLLELYLRVVDPYSLNKQGEDEGVQYRTGIYFTDPSERQAILKYFESIDLKNHMIEIKPLKKFFDAEKYHQDYLQIHPTGYCHINMAMLRDDERK